MMKKTILTVSLALILVACLSVTAFAGSAVAPLPATVDVAGSTVPAGATLQVLADDAAIPGLQAERDRLGLNGTLIASLNISLVGATGPVTIRVSCPGLHANGTITVLHQRADGSYEVIPAVCSEGSFSFTVSSFSSFGFVLSSAGTPAGASTTPASPQTGVYTL